MKTILSIGMTKWACPDAKTPAQIADMLSRLNPVEEEFPNNNVGNPVLTEKRDYGHEVSITELTRPVLSKAQYEKWLVATARSQKNTNTDGKEKE